MNRGATILKRLSTKIWRHEIKPVVRWRARCSHALLGMFLVMVLLVVGTAGCVSTNYSSTESNIGGSDLAGSSKEIPTYVEVTLPGPDLGSALRGPTNNETGAIFPSDLQRHNFFSGTT